MAQKKTISVDNAECIDKVRGFSSFGGKMVYILGTKNTSGIIFYVEQ